MLRDWLGRFGHLSGEDRLRRAAGKRWTSGQKLVSQHTDGVDIHAVVEQGVGGCLFRSHVGRRAERHTRGRQRLPAGRLAHGLGDAEVRHQGVLSGDQHVVGLDIPMHDAVLVGVCQRIHDLTKDPHRGTHRQLPFALELGAERFPLDVRHDVVQETVGLTRVVEWQDVWVSELRGDFDFAEEPLRPQSGGQVRTENLDRNPPIVLQVVGEVDDRHTAGPNLTLDAITVLESGLEALHLVAHMGQKMQDWRGGREGPCAV